MKSGKQDRDKEEIVEAAEAIAREAAEKAEAPEKGAEAKAAKEERGAEAEKAAKEKEEAAAAKRAAEEAEARAADYKDKWMRAVAEFENYKRRNADLRRTSYRDGMQEVLLKILPVGDALERALGMEMDEKTREGVAMVARRFSETLADMGVEAIRPAPGDAFDPNLMEAVVQTEKEEGEESGKVKDAFRVGYRLDGKVVRYAQVRVVK